MLSLASYDGRMSEEMMSKHLNYTSINNTHAIITVNIVTVIKFDMWYIYIYTYACVCISVCVYIYIYI